MEQDIIRPWYNNSSNDGSSCFDVQFTNDAVQTRNSRDPERVTEYTPAEWHAFTSGVKAGKFDLPE
ncbi:DUF397 domain-containing protein [Streptomyces sp. NPDC005562]|uniref:DUF397 domain-containing protein n=1 Tax=Streptomyces sp. NPDC005562 TaxID=3154890 RepID=UPI0033B235C7